jgi:phage terminase large subunit-like protein
MAHVSPPVAEIKRADGSGRTRPRRPSGGLSGASASLVEFAAECGLDLEPFQRRISKAAAGPEREFVCLLPRGNGKTSLLAIVALHHLLTVERAEVYCSAASRDQARILFEAAARYARALGHPSIVFRHLELRWCEDPDEPKVYSRFLRVLAADAPKLHGLTPSLAIIDELHAHKDDEVYLALRTATLKRAGSKLVVISTAGAGADSPLGRLRARALSLPHVTKRGCFADARGPDLRMMEWAVPEGADVDDAKLVKKANPASWLKVEDLRAQRAAVPDLAYRRYHCNMWTEREGFWLPPGSWQQCIGEPEFRPGEKIWVGVDIGGERSSSAVVWVNADLQVGCFITEGERGVIEAGERIRDLAAEFEIVELAYDPWRAGQLAQELKDARIHVEPFAQHPQKMIPASQRLHAAITERRITLPDDPELRAHAANTIAQHSYRGWRISSPGRGVQIDSVVALAMALDRLEDRPEPGKFWGWV